MSVPRLLVRPDVAAFLLILFEVANVSEVVGTFGGVSPEVAVLGFGVVATFVGVRQGTVQLVWSPVFLMIGVFVATRAVTVFGASDPDLVFGVVGDLMKDVVFLVVLTALLSSMDDVRRAVRVLVLVATVLAGMTAIQEFFLHNSTTFSGFSTVPLAGDLGAATARHAGPETDANFWARTLVLFVPLALSLWASSRQRRREVWLGMAFVLCVGVYLTQSRGGLLALVGGLLAWFLLAGRQYVRLLAFAPAIGMVLLLFTGVGSRLSTLTEVPASGWERRDPSLVGRSSAQRAALVMARDRPVLGVGAGNFEVVERDYLRNSGLSHLTVLAPHNLYLQMLAEGGVVGLAGWLVFYGSAAFVTTRALLLFRGFGDSSPASQRVMCVGVLAALVGWAVASVALHVAYFGVLLTVVAVGIALDHRARLPGGRMAVGSDEVALAAASDGRGSAVPTAT